MTDNKLKHINRFTAVDFETATSNRMICQIGIVVVENNKITDRFLKYVQPPENKYDAATIRVHHITPEKTKSSQTFEEMWPDIRHYFVNTTIFAHNKSFDEDALYKNFEYYGIMPMGISPFYCTCEAFQKTSLESLCAGFCIPYNSELHHDALFDAECCAQFAIKYIANEQPNWNEVKRVNEEKKERDKQKIKSTQKHEQLHGNVLVKDLSDADPNNPLYDRKIVITGIFRQDRKELAEIIKSMGADIDKSITKKTHYVLIGEEPGPKKIEKLDKLIHDGYNIRKLYQKDIDIILEGYGKDYYEEKEIKKDLDFTIEHYNKHHISFNYKNIIASKELYFGKGITGNIDLFKQITGNLGAFGDDKIYSDTNICVLSNSTLEKLKCGEKDETILYIQDFYNKNKSITFEFQFLSENEILEFCKERCEICRDELTLKMYNRYIMSFPPPSETTPTLKKSSANK